MIHCHESVSSVENLSNNNKEACREKIAIKKLLNKAKEKRKRK